MKALFFNAMKKILLIGKNGQLGTTIIKKYRDLNIYSLTKKDLDITRQNQVNDVINCHKPDVIINCAGYTNVEKAETYFDDAFNVNGKALEYLSKSAKMHNALLIHYSTDYVFDGLKKKPYLSSDITSPLNKYGESKLMGEKYIINSGCKYYIIRVSWLMSIYRENFIKTILMKIKLKQNLRIVFDQIGSPTSTDLVAGITRKLIDIKTKHTSEVFHVSSKGTISWYILCKYILEILHYGKWDNILEPIESKTLKSKVLRPSYSVFAHEEIENFLNIQLPNWKDDMRPIILKLIKEENF